MQFNVKSSDDFKQVVNTMHTMSFPFRVSIAKGKEKRTDAMNRTIHKWFGEIAAHRGDVTALEVKAENNLAYGAPIKRRDDQEWAGCFGYLFDSLNHAAKLKAIRLLDIPVTRNMSVDQLCEYMDQMQRDCAEQGIPLTIPEGKGE